MNPSVRIRMREHCARIGCSLRQAAARMNLSVPLLSNYNRGTVLPGLTQLLVLARFFGVSRIDDLIGIGDGSRIVPIYLEPVSIHPAFRRYLWDCPGRAAPLEKLVHRVLIYGKFEDVRSVYRQYPEATRYAVEAYPDLRRGVRYHVRRWAGRRGKSDPA